MSNHDRADWELLSDVSVIELVPSIARESFGLGYAALNLTAALERAGANVYLATVDEETDAYEACEEAGFPKERLIRGALIGPSRLRLAPFLVRQLSRIPNSGRLIVHSHGLWTYLSYVAGVLRRRWECPLVLSPHGSLQPPALAISPRKKALATLLYERQNLKEASCLCALSEQEEASIRVYGFSGRVEVISSGVSRAILCRTEEIAEFRSRHDVAPGFKVLLFLSRVAKIKNLPLLLRAFAGGVKIHPEWILMIAGSDERGHTREVQALIRELQIEKSVRVIGPVSGKEKALAFTSSSVFVLPSLSEGLPIAVLEAMEYAKPVLLTEGWTLPVTTDSKFGWRVPGEDRAFESALLDAMNTPEDLLKEMGHCARAVVRENFGWDGIAKQACALYASLLADGHEVEN